MACWNYKFLSPKLQYRLLSYFMRMGVYKSICMSEFAKLQNFIVKIAIFHCRIPSNNLLKMEDRYTNRLLLHCIFIKVESPKLECRPINGVIDGEISGVISGY